jgi:hypothetical protein
MARAGSQTSKIDLRTKTLTSLPAQKAPWIVAPPRVGVIWDLKAALLFSELRADLRCCDDESRTFGLRSSTPN